MQSKQISAPQTQAADSGWCAWSSARIHITLSFFQPRHSPQVIVHHVVQLSSHLHTGGAATAHHEGQQLLALLQGCAVWGLVSFCVCLAGLANSNSPCSSCPKSLQKVGAHTFSSLLARSHLLRGHGQGGTLEALAHALAQPVGVLNGLEEEAVLVHTLDAEGVVDGANLRVGCRCV